jgi:hypothetical protein
MYGEVNVVLPCWIVVGLWRNLPGGNRQFPSVRCSVFVQASDEVRGALSSRKRDYLLHCIRTACLILMSIIGRQNAQLENLIHTFLPLRNRKIDRRGCMNSAEVQVMHRHSGANYMCNCLQNPLDLADLAFNGTNFGAGLSRKYRSSPVGAKKVRWTLVNFEKNWIPPPLEGNNWPIR